MGCSGSSKITTEEPQSMRSLSSKRSYSMSKQQSINYEKRALRENIKKNAGVNKFTSKDLKDSGVCENIEVLKDQKPTKNQIQYLIECLNKHFVFSSLSKIELKILTRYMFFCKVIAGVTVIKQGDSANSFFIIEKGELVVSIDGKKRRKLEAGD